MKFESKYGIDDVLYVAIGDEDQGDIVIRIAVNEIRINSNGKDINVNYRSEYNHWYHENSCFKTMEEAFESLK